MHPMHAADVIMHDSVEAVCTPALAQHVLQMQHPDAALVHRSVLVPWQVQCVMHMMPECCGRVYHDFWP